MMMTLLHAGTRLRFCSTDPAEHEHVTTASDSHLHPPVETPQALAQHVRAADFALLATAGATPLRHVITELNLPPLHSQNPPQNHPSDGVSSPGAGIVSGPHGMLIIGPEGDFTPQELESLVGAGAIPVGLGRHRLRVETAAVALLSATMLLLEP